MELASCETLFAKRVHPYTEALISAAPVPDPTRVRSEAPVEGEVPSPIYPPRGGAFQPRCPLAIERCRVALPPLVPMPDGRTVAVRAPAKAALAEQTATYCSSRQTAQPQILLSGKLEKPLKPLGLKDI